MKNAIKTNKLFIDGPITSERDTYNPFQSAMAHVMDRFPHIRVLHPHKVVDEYADRREWKEGDYTRAIIRGLMDCDAAIFLPDWESDKNCKARHTLCQAIGIPTIHAASTDLYNFLGEEFAAVTADPESWNKLVIDSKAE
jgi:hypothetical protein